MLKNHNSSAIVAVSDLRARARTFYGGVLGLARVEERGEESVLTYRTCASWLVV